MKVQELKVGDSFEVVEVLENLGYDHLRGKQGISLQSSEYKHGVDFILFDDIYAEYQDNTGFEFPYLYHEEVKPIGKLTITKLK